MKTLSEIDPTYESYQGNVSCFFCGNFEEDDSGKIIHATDCIWVNSQLQEIKLPAERLEILKDDPFYENGLGRHLVWCFSKRYEIGI